MVPHRHEPTDQERRKFPSLAPLLKKDPVLRLELETARKYGLTPKQFWELDTTEQQYMLALEAVEAEEKAYACPICGGDSRECQAPESRFAYDHETRRCYKQEVVMMNAERYAKDRMAGTIVPKVSRNPSVVAANIERARRRKQK